MTYKVIYLKSYKEIMEKKFSLKKEEGLTNLKKPL